MKAHYLQLLLLSPLQDIDEAQFKRIVVQATELVPKSAYANLVRSSHQHVLSYLEKLRASVHGDQPLVEGDDSKSVPCLVYPSIFKAGHSHARDIASRVD